MMPSFDLPPFFRLLDREAAFFDLGLADVFFLVFTINGLDKGMKVKKKLKFHPKSVTKQAKNKLKRIVATEIQLLRIRNRINYSIY